LTTLSAALALTSLAFTGLSLAVPAATRAQDSGSSASAVAYGEEADPGAGSSGTADPSLSDEQALANEAGGGATVPRDSTDPFEDPHEGYYFVGLMYRQTVVPQFMQNLFVDGGTAVSNPGFGGQFEYRKNNFSILGNLWWQDFAFKGPYREAGDPATNTEILDSNWSILFASAAFLWSTPFNDVVAIEYGLDVGLGVVLGDGVRTEGFSTDGNQTFTACNGAGDPRDTSRGYCTPPVSGGATDLDGQDGEHYGVVARKWSDGGSVPNVIPWLGLPHIALRIKPIHQVQIRLDGGFFGGFWFGASLSYGI
jgi:hypothetical protein